MHWLAGTPGFLPLPCYGAEEEQGAHKVPAPLSFLLQAHQDPNSLLIS